MTAEAIEAMRLRRDTIDAHIAELTVERRELERRLRVANVRAIEKRQAEDRKALVANPTHWLDEIEDRAEQRGESA